MMYTDGACSGNPGPGGWAALLRWNDHEKLVSGGDPSTTNNRMELLAVIQGLRSLKRGCSVRIVTDSRYVMDGMTKWLAGWRRRGWKTASKAPVKNQDLWESLDREISLHEVEWEWVRGHSGHEENARVDEAARAAIPF
ncbi:MAG: ribonuclease HI [Acidobacteria bacterium]|nr:ribonuclease HI [Acidobacteriota bacterium]